MELTSYIYIQTIRVAWLVGGWTAMDFSGWVGMGAKRKGGSK